MSETTTTEDKTSDKKKEKTKAVKVRVASQPIGEDGNHYKPGEVFETTPERAAALGSLVTIL